MCVFLIGGDLVTLCAFARALREELHRGRCVQQVSQDS